MSAETQAGLEFGPTDVTDHRIGVGALHVALQVNIVLQSQVAECAVDRVFMGVDKFFVQCEPSS